MNLLRSSLLTGALALGTIAATPATQPATFSDVQAGVVNQQLTAPTPIQPFDFSTAPKPDDKIQPLPKKSAALKSVVPDAKLRDKPLALPTTQPVQTRVRSQPTTDVPLLASAADPSRPTHPVLPAGPRIAVDSPTDQTWLPLPNVLKLRGESPVRAHEPILDPTGGSSLGPNLGVFRATATNGMRLAIPDPFENVRDIQLQTTPEDEDPVVSPLGLPTGRITLTLEKVPTPPPPPPQPAKPPTTQPK